ncbi:unannotated protein [freshwater metagenome]|uniref:Unannotated protein n=1 Tax=freshwater metagenome TaxID=449393 RepID=A0A6J6Y0Q9_9ZZZZ
MLASGPGPTAAIPSSELSARRVVRNPITDNA